MELCSICKDKANCKRYAKVLNSKKLELSVLNKRIEELKKEVALK